LPDVFGRRLEALALEAAGLEDAAAGRQADGLHLLGFEPVEQEDEGEGGGEDEDRLAFGASAEPAAGEIDVDTGVRRGPVAAGRGVALEHVVHHEGETRVGHGCAVRDEREHGHPPRARGQAGVGEGGVDHGPVEIGVGVVVDAPALGAAGGAAAAEDLPGLRGGEAQ